VLVAPPPVAGGDLPVAANRDALPQHPGRHGHQAVEVSGASEQAGIVAAHEEQLVHPQVPEPGQLLLVEQRGGQWPARVRCQPASSLAGIPVRAQQVGSEPLGDPSFRLRW